MKIVNNTKGKLQNQDVTTGIFLISANSMVAEACATTNLDWLMIDMEASAMNKKELLQMLQAIGNTQISPFVRVPEINRHLIEHALDLGASGILVPKIESAKDAEYFVESCYFPPKGKRGVNPVRASNYFSEVKSYLQNFNDTVLTMIQIETSLGLENIHEIVEVQGIDVVFIGCGDLASSLGQPGDVTGPVMEKAIKKILDATISAGKIPGIFAYSTELAIQYAAEGFKFIAIGNDIKFLKENIQSNVNRLKREQIVVL